MTSNEREPLRLIERDDLEGDRAKAALLLSKVEAPRSSASARARVWARLDRPQPAKRPYAVAALSGATLAVAAGLFLRAMQPRMIEVVAGEGVAIERSADSPRRIVRSKGAARISVGGLVMIDLAPDTELLAAAGETSVAIELLEGGIVAMPLEGELPRLHIASRPYTIEGTGVRARVVRVARGEVQIEVLSGEAVLSSPAGSRSMHTGDKFDSAEKIAGATRTPSIEPEPEPEVEARKPAPRPRARKQEQKRRAAAREAEAKLEAKEAEGDGKEDAPAHEAGAAKRDVDDRAASNEPEAEAPPRDATPAIPEPIDWALLYRRAREERDPGRAVEMFDRLAKSGSPWAEVSAFQAARLQMRRGRCPDAIDRFMTLIGGTFDSEARLDVIECQLQVGDLVAAQRSLDNFLKTHPKSEREADLRFLRAELMRKRDRCSDAIPDYESAQQSRHADDALYFTAWCKLHIGRTDDGLRTLRDYLERFPNGRHAGEAKKKL